MNIIDQFTNAWKIFCRPPRQTYSVFDLGPHLFQTKLYKCKRHEFKVKNSRGHTLECSFYEPVGVQNPECIIYLHCFNGSRIESIKFAEPSISRGCAFCCFDFSGSGLSEGEYVSLGYYEQDDVKVVVSHLRSQFNVKSIALWGRSMGAVTALLYTQKYPTEVQALAIDSAFVSMWDAGVEIADKKVSLPTFIIKGLLEYVKRQIKQNAGYDMEDVNTIKDIQKCLMPALFIVSKEDKLVSFENSQKLYEKYPVNAKKNILYVKGDHNECRSWEDVLKIADFLSGSIKMENKNEIPQNKENFHLIQANQSNYNTPNNREEQKQQSVIKLIHYQQQQANTKQNDLSPPSNIQLHNSSNQRSPSGSISSESPANQLYKMPQSHTHSYHTSQITQQNQTITHHYILHNQQSSLPHHHSQHQSISRPTSQLSNQKDHLNFSNNQQSVQAKKPLHQHSTSNITADHYKQLGIAGVGEEKNQPVIDQNDIDNNPLVQQLLKELIQKNYANDFKAPIEISQLPYQNSPLNQAQQFQQQQDQKSGNFTQKMNELEYKQQFVLNKGIQNLQNQLQVQQSLTSSQLNLNSNSQIETNQISDSAQNFINIPLQNPQQNIGSRKNSVVSPTNIDMKTSNIPDEMHEIDFPKAKDFRTKQKINNYTFQLHPPMNTFSSSTVATTKDYNIQQSTPQNEQTQRKQSILLENNYNNQIIQLSQINPVQQYVPKLNHNSAFSTLNNSPQFFNDKASISPRKQLQNLPANKNLSQIQGEESINVPNQISFTQNNFINTQPQQQVLIQQQQQYQQQQQQFKLQQGNNTQQNPQQKKWGQQNENSIQKANIQNTQEEEDFHNLPQSTLTINLKQKKRQSIDYSVSISQPQTERQNMSDAEQRKQQFDIQQRKSTLDNLLQKPLSNQQKTISSNNIIDAPNELEGSMMLNSGMRAEQRSTVSNNIKQKCMNNSTHQSASIVKVNHSQHQDSSYVIQNLQQSQQVFQTLFSSNIQHSQINMPQIQNQDSYQDQNDQQQKQQLFVQQQQLKQQILPLILQQQEEIKQQQLKQQQEQMQQEIQKNIQNQQDEASFGKQRRISGLSQEKFRNDKSTDQQSRQGKFLDKSQIDRNKSRERSQDLKHKEKYKKEIQQLQRAEEQITQIQQNNYFVNVGSKQQYQNESNRSSFQQQETFSYLQQDQNKTGSNKNSQNNSIFQPSTNTTKEQRFLQDIRSQTFQQPQISDVVTNSPLNRFQPFSSKNHQSKNSSHVFRYKLDIENILNKNYSQKNQLNNSFLNQESLSRERDSKNQQNYSSNQISSYHQQSLDFSNQNQQKKKQQNDKKELIRYDSLNDEPSSQKTRQNTSQISHSNNNLNIQNGNSSFQQMTPNQTQVQSQIPFSQLPKSSQKVIELQQQFIQQKMLNQQNRSGQSPSMNYSRGLNQISTPSNQKQANQVNNSSASSFKQIGNKNQNDSLEMNKQQVQQQQIQNRLTKEQNETFNSKYQQYVNGLSINTYGKIQTPTNLFSSKHESKQQQNSNSQQQLTNQPNGQQIQQNSNLTHSISNSKMYAANPSSDHSKHKILQKSIKDKKPIEGQSSTKGNQQQQLDFTQKVANLNNGIMQSLSQEDYAKLKKKQDMMSYIQKNRNIAMNIDPQQGQNVNTSVADESQILNKISSQNIQNPNHKNRFVNNNNFDSQDQFSTRQVEPLQSSQYPLSKQIGKYSGNQNFDGNISKKASQTSSSTNTAGFFQYKNNNSSSTMNAIEQYQNSKINNPSSLSPNQRLVTCQASSTTSQKFAFKNRVNQATKVVQIQLGDKRHGDQSSFEGHNSSINNSSIMQYQQPSRSSQSPNHKLFQKQ